MQRGQILQFLEPRFHHVVEEHGLSENRAAMDHTVANGIDVRVLVEKCTEDVA